MKITMYVSPFDTTEVSNLFMNIYKDKVDEIILWDGMADSLPHEINDFPCILIGYDMYGVQNPVINFKDGPVDIQYYLDNIPEPIPEPEPDGGLTGDPIIE